MVRRVVAPGTVVGLDRGTGHECGGREPGGGLGGNRADAGGDDATGADQGT
jgi:hypothetical protein